MTLTMAGQKLNRRNRVLKNPSTRLDSERVPSACAESYRHSKQMLLPSSIHITSTHKRTVDVGSSCLLGIATVNEVYKRGI